MASQAFQERGGTEAEYRIYQALLRTGRRESTDFVFSPPFEGEGVSFIVSVPRVGLVLSDPLLNDGAEVIRAAASRLDVKVIQESEALSRPDRALSEALRG